MTSITNPSLGSKAQLISSAPLNIQSSISSNDQQLSSQRSSNASGAGGPNLGGRNQSAARNIQASKTKHKNHRKPSIQRDDLIQEVIAMTTSTASRKGRTSITHLMDWSAPSPRVQHGHHHHPHHRGPNSNRKTPSWGLGSGYHAVDKARYVNANYRFIVDPTGDYRAQSLDPDSTLPWTNILQVLASSITQTASCPICLCDPVAARMARCGHIFCLPCLIRYMASQEEPPKPGQPGYYHPTANQNKQKWKKCPICYDSVYMNEVRPVKFYTGKEAPPPREGSDVILRLMMREPGSTLALPKDVANTVLAGSTFGKNGSQSEKDTIPWHYAAEVTDYARIMKGSQSYLKQEFEREISELEEQEKVDEVMFGDDTDWVKKAIGKIKSAIEKIKDMPDKEVEKHEKILGRELYEKHLLEAAQERAALTAQRGPLVPQTELEVPDMYLVTSSSAQNGVLQHDLQEQEKPLEQASTGADPRAAAPKSPTRHRAPKPIDTHDPNQPYFFYQALPHSYLSPLDIRILKVAFGSFSSFPSTVLPRVENFSMGHVVDDDLRKRAKYLSHLPYGCDVAFLECDWTDIVPADVLDKFSADIERRRKRKREKDTREERDRARAEREEDEKRWSGARRQRRGGEDDEVSMAIEMSRRDLDIVNPGALNQTELTEDESEMDTHMINGPKFGFASLPQSSPPNTRTVWGTPIVAGGNEAEYKPPEEKRPANSGWLEDWEKDVIAIEQASLSSAANNGGSTGKGKKKFKKVTLMTNTGKRGA